MQEEQDKTKELQRSQQLMASVNIIHPSRQREQLKACGRKALAGEINFQFLTQRKGEIL